MNKSLLTFSGKQITTNSYEETERLGEEFAKHLQPADLVYLIGDLGSGKTTFTKGIAKGLGYEGRVISPTFVLVRQYYIASEKIKNKIERIYHIDLYRMEEESDVKGLGIMEMLQSGNAVVLIEWPERSEKVLSENRWEIKFTVTREDTREIKFEKIIGKGEVR